MSTGDSTVKKATARESSCASPSADPAEVRAAVQRVLASREFRNSRRCSDFFTYVVEARLGGRADQLKERTIGIEAFGRSVDYDPSEDASVRVCAGEVRRRLELYYSDEGRAEALRIELPAGAYIPEFRPHAPATPAPPRPRDKPRWLGMRRRIWLGLALLACAVAAAVTFRQFRRPAPPPPSMLARFWAPWLHPGNPVLISAAFVPVYAPSSPPAITGRSGSFVQLNDQFVGGGDLLAVSRLSRLLGRYARPFQVRLGNQASYLDLRAAPAILVGYSYTHWAPISREFRYGIHIASEPFGITNHGRPTAWKLRQLTPHRHTPEDYALVTRAFEPGGGAPLLEIAGITQYGTEAAARLVSSHRLLAAALAHAPVGWNLENLQLVLHVRVLAGTVGQPRVLRTYFWPAR